MEYQEDRPADAESPIECVWEFRGSGLDPQRISTDARAEIIVQLADPAEQWDGNAWQRQPRELFSGQITHPLLIRPTGATHTVGIRFKTWATAMACASDASAVTDQLFDLGAISARLMERCRVTAQLPRAERLRAVTGIFSDRSSGVHLPAERIRFAVMEAEANHGDMRVAAWARTSHMSVRSFERHLAAAVGVRPKLLLRMLRFRTAAKLVEAGKPAAGIAAALNYSDQSHLYKDFVRFAGSTPTGFASAETAMAANFFRNT